jgi:hypothetical protein
MYYARRQRLGGLGDDYAQVSDSVLSDSDYAEVSNAIQGAQYGMDAALARRAQIGRELAQIKQVRYPGAAPSKIEFRLARMHSYQANIAGQFALKLQTLREVHREALLRRARLQAEEQERARHERSMKEFQARINANRARQKAEYERSIRELQERIAANEALIRAAQEERVAGGE